MVSVTRREEPLERPEASGDASSTVRMVVLVSAVGAAGLLLIASAALLLGRTSENYLEPVFETHLRAWVRGAPLFGDLEKPPFNLAVYGPLFYALTAGPIAALGGGHQAGLLSLRAFALVGLVAAVILAIRLSRELGASKVLSLAVVPFILASTVWWPLSGPTQLSSVMELAGLYAFVKRGRPTILAFVCLGLATVFKQNAVGVAAGLFAYSLWSKETRRSVPLMVVIYLAVVAIGHLVPEVVSHRRYLTGITLNAVTDSKSFWHGFYTCRDVIIGLAPALAVALVCGSGLRLTNGQRATLAAGLCSFGLALLSSTKSGATANYFCTSALVLPALAVGLGSAIPAILAVASMVALLGLLPTREQFSLWKAAITRRPAYESVMAALSRLPAGPVISDLPQISTLSGREPWIIEPYTFDLAVQRQPAMLTTFIEQINRCVPAAFVLFPEEQARFPRLLWPGKWAPGFREALFAHYDRIDSGTSEFVLFARKPGCAIEGAKASP